MKDAAAVDPTAAKQLLVKCVCCCPSRAVKGKGADRDGKAGMRDEGRGAGKRD